MHAEDCALMCQLTHMGPCAAARHRAPPPRRPRPQRHRPAQAPPPRRTRSLAARHAPLSLAAGRRTNSNVEHWLPVVAPSRRREPAHKSFPKEMDAADIARVAADFASAALRCKQGGLDGVELLASGPGRRRPVGTARISSLARVWMRDACRRPRSLPAM